ncbi:MAG: hypothetical protein IT269_06650 [Saprospiraceae bacterium]|nr:hypothetical protein [Saprospiraceae bacterium]
MNPSNFFQPVIRLVLPIFLVMTFVLSAQAQYEKTLFQNKKIEDSGGWGGYRHEFGEVAGTSSSISGFHLVSEYNHKFLAGYNFNWVTNDLPVKYQEKEQNLRLNWHSLYLGYMLNPHWAVHPVINTDLGIGRTKIKDVGKDRIFVVSPSAGIEINLYRWFHLSLEAGYRSVFDVEMAGLKDADLSGVFGMVNLKFGMSEDKGNNKPKD